MRNKSLVTLAITDHTNEVIERHFIIRSGVVCSVFVSELEQALKRAKEPNPGPIKVLHYESNSKTIDIQWSKKFRSHEISVIELDKAKIVNHVGMEA